ncbi:unnamed protein product [Rotaria sordida]|uniref:Uncharacterized protein n=1 Tax=Rotaria sordida TaxID=392033 RepID=A0A815D673_9BILA|nr:unnamed protein product [Rotaria sordida]CAF1568918.1 unnamed protein product [Rotaria sordida]
MLPINWTNVVAVNVNGYRNQNEDVYGVMTTKSSEFEKTNVVLDDSLRLKLAQHRPKTVVDIKSKDCTRLATSDQHLFHCKLDEIYAFEINSMERRHIPWDKDDWIIDICYSTLLELFFIWSNSGFYTFDSSTMEKRQTIENIRDTGTGWYRCTCFDKFLFLSYDYNIEQRKIEIEENEYELINEWKLAVENDNELIRCMKVNELRIVLGIGEYHRTDRFELHDYNMNILHTLNFNILDIALLPHAKWLIVVKSSNKLTIVNNDGEVEETTYYNCKDNVLNSITFGSNMLVIETCNQLYFHDI